MTTTFYLTTNSYKPLKGRDLVNICGNNLIVKLLHICSRISDVTIIRSMDRSNNSHLLLPAASNLGPAINIRASWRGFPTTVTAAVSVPNQREPDGYKYYLFSRGENLCCGSTVSFQWYLWDHTSWLLLFFNFFFWGGVVMENNLSRSCDKFGTLFFSGKVLWEEPCVQVCVKQMYMSLRVVLTFILGEFPLQVL